MSPDASRLAALFAAVAVCALIQSVFGVGLLVFGTPALLVLGFSFPEALACLLPCSILISSLQLRETADGAKGWSKRELAVLGLSAAAGAAAVFNAGGTVDIKRAVGFMLVLSAALRFFEGWRARLATALGARLAPALGVIGLIHGFTNMGGGLLAALVGSLHLDKKNARAAIAEGYLLMASIQLFLLFALKGLPIAPAVPLGLVALSGAVYGLIGRRAFTASSQRVYQHSMTGLMLAAAAVLLR